MNQLKYFAGAQQGKALKKPTTPTPAAEKRRKYEKEVRKRTFQSSWQIGRRWLMYDESKKVLSCSTCVCYFNTPEKIASFKGDGKNWLDGVSSLKKDNITKHETSKSHLLANERQPLPETGSPKLTKAAEALRKLRNIDRKQLIYKVLNAHAVAKSDMTFKTYVRLCELDHAKGLNVNTTYETDKSGNQFIHFIAKDTINNIHRAVQEAKYVSVTIDGCADSSGIEQESLYVHFATNGTVHQHFLCFVSPSTTSAQDIYNAVNTSLDGYVPGIMEKLVCLACDGASNMMGVRKGLAALLKTDHPELVAIHCLAHRLELGIRDAFKKLKLFGKSMTLLVGLYYFYKKSLKQRKELLNAFEIVQEKALMPTRAGGTRWVSHIVKSVPVLFKLYRGFMTHLANASHKNSKAGGLYKIAIIALKEILEPVQRLSLLLQRSDTNLGEEQILLLGQGDKLSFRKQKKQTTVVADAPVTVSDEDEDGAAYELPAVTSDEQYDSSSSEDSDYESGYDSDENYEINAEKLMQYI
ncbi:zinc finger protein 862-like [Mercenaria mercenaria]|uniref:zinc finger protein 862-like n=1 Tax=Mercenaria mercenaria TaxID=6596 RepID=UPI00234F7F9A|nr:zinc finger protein 862-like [Mercenaria mercenaria]